MEDDVKCTQVYATEADARAAASAFFNSGSAAAEALLRRLRAAGASDETLRYLTSKPRCLCPARETKIPNRPWGLAISLYEPNNGPLVLLNLTCDGQVHYEDIHRGG